MTKTRSQHLYKFKGKIIKKKLATSSPQSKYAGQSYYVLNILQSDKTKRSLQVFKSKLDHDYMWTSIESGTYSGSTYNFFCRNQKGYYYLVNWEEIPVKKKGEGK